MGSSLERKFTLTHWVMDWFELLVGPVESFDDLQVRWMGRADLPKGVDLYKAGSSAYKPLQSHRKSVITFEKGKAGVH